MAVTVDKRGVNNGIHGDRWTYTSDVAVVQGTPAEIAIDVPFPYGVIREVAFESSSPDCQFYVSEVSGAAATDIETRINVDGINLGYSTSFTTPVSFSNGDSPMVKKLYVNVVNNSVTVTGTWKLLLSPSR